MHPLTNQQWEHIICHPGSGRRGDRLFSWCSFRSHCFEHTRIHTHRSAHCLPALTVVPLSVSFAGLFQLRPIFYCRPRPPHHQIGDRYLHRRTNASHINWRYGPMGTSKQPRDVFNSHKTAASIKHQECTFYRPMPRYQSAAQENNGPLKIVIHKHHLALFSALGETRQTQTPKRLPPARSPVCVAFFSTCVGAAQGPGPFPACSADLCRSLSTHTLAGCLG